MEKVIIRKVRLSDAKGILVAIKEVALDTKWVLTEADELPKTVAKERAFLRARLKSRNSTIAVAVDDGEIVALILADGGNRRRIAHVATIGIVIRKKWRGQGLGARMIEYMIRWARRTEIKKLKLSVTEGNNVALRLYKKMGFVREGLSLRDVRRRGRYHNSIEMARFVK